MDAKHVRKAAGLFFEARRSGKLVENLPADCRPATLQEALAIQEETVARLNEPLAGWKTGPVVEGSVVSGAVLSARVFQSPARIPAKLVPLLGVEAEIAFVFSRDLPARAEPYTRQEIEAAVTAVVAIDVVDTRFKSLDGTTVLDRAADCVSSGALVRGTGPADWRRFDLVNPLVSVKFDGEIIARKNGGHARGEPILPAIDLVNQLRHGAGVGAGKIVTTGPYTGIHFAKPGQTVTVDFEGFGSAQVLFGT